MIIFQMLPSCSELVSSCLLFSLALILFPSLSSFYFILPSFSLLSMRDWRGMCAWLQAKRCWGLGAVIWHLCVFSPTGDHPSENRPWLCVRVPRQIPKGCLRCPSFPHYSRGRQWECHQGGWLSGWHVFRTTQEKKVSSHNLIICSSEPPARGPTQCYLNRVLWVCPSRKSNLPSEKYLVALSLCHFISGNVQFSVLNYRVDSLWKINFIFNSNQRTHNS